MTRADPVVEIRKDLFELLFLMREKMRKLVRGLDDHISPVQVLILRLLVEQGPMPQHELAKALSRDKSQIARLVQGLETKMLISRKQNPTDKRVWIIKACPPVQAKISGFVAEEKRLVAEMLAGVPQADLQIFQKVLAKMLRQI